MAKTRKRGDLKKDNLDYFSMKDSKFSTFYLLHNIHKRLHNAPCRPIISNSGYYTEKTSSFPDHYLQLLPQAVKSYVKDTNLFLKRLILYPKLPKSIILCTMDVVGLYASIPHEEGLFALRKQLESRKDKYASPDTIIDLAELVLKSDIFTFMKKTVIKNGGLLLVQKLHLGIALHLWQKNR